MLDRLDNVMTHALVSLHCGKTLVLARSQLRLSPGATGGGNGRSCTVSPAINAVEIGISRHTPGRSIKGSEATTLALPEKCANRSASGYDRIESTSSLTNSLFTDREAYRAALSFLPSVRPIVICTGSGIPVVFAVAWMLGFLRSLQHLTFQGVAHVVIEGSSAAWSWCSVDSGAGATFAGRRVGCRSPKRGDHGKCRQSRKGRPT